MWCTVNGLINAHFQIYASYLKHAAYLIVAPHENNSKILGIENNSKIENNIHENNSKILGISIKEQNHSTHSVSCLINRALRISSCSVSSSKQGWTFLRKRYGSLDGLDVSILIFSPKASSEFCLAFYSYEIKRLSLLNASYQLNAPAWTPTIKQTPWAFVRLFTV